MDGFYLPAARVFWFLNLSPLSVYHIYLLFFFSSDSYLDIYDPPRVVVLFLCYHDYLLAATHLMLCIVIGSLGNIPCSIYSFFGGTLVGSVISLNALESWSGTLTATIVFYAGVLCGRLTAEMETAR
jgi:hypothetical protein